jgi:dTDP-glucose pyrophosphorylase
MSPDSVLNIVVPMAGRGSRFAAVGFTDPKPLIPLGGRPMIQWVIDNIRPQRPHRFLFLCLAEHLERYPALKPRLESLCPGCVVIPVDRVTEGAACTVLLAREYINSDAPLMIANSDQFVELEVEAYLAQLDQPGVAGIIMTFWSDHPKWSYCRLRPDGSVSEVVEKQVISNEATVGIYNFAKGSDFVAAAETMIARNLRVNGEFYVAPAYNLLIEQGARILTVATGREGAGMHGLGTPEDFRLFQETAVFRARSTPAPSHAAP